MTIQLKKFGNVLTSRQAGREAFFAFAPTLASVADKETVEVDFDGVFAVGPSWVEEFLRPLFERFENRVWLLPSKNASVIATLQLLEKTLERKLL